VTTAVYHKHSAAITPVDCGDKFDRLMLGFSWFFSLTLFLQLFLNLQILPLIDSFSIVPYFQLNPLTPTVAIWIQL